MGGRVRRWLFRSMLASAVLSGSSCSTPGNQGVWEWNSRKISQFWLQSLSSNLTRGWQTIDIRPYLEYFGFVMKGVTYSVASVRVGDVDIFVLRCRPDEPRSRTLIIHGYMGNAGHYAALASALVHNGVEVLIMDLPGHGLSSGPRNTVSDFHQYGDAIGAVLAFAGEDPVSRHLPLTGFGHSTGGAAWLDFLVRYPEEAARVVRIVLAAPIIRPTSWEFKNFAVGLLVPGPVDIPRVPLVSPGAIGNKQFRDFQLYGDPLYNPIFDPTWIKALETWNNEVATWKAVDWHGSLLIVQGTADDVVDWRWNIPRFQELVPGTRVAMFPGLSHNILQEKPIYLEPVYYRVVGELSGTVPVSIE